MAERWQGDPILASLYAIAERHPREIEVCQAAARWIERLQAIMNTLVPQTYGEAILIYPWLPCQPHEWDNRTTKENAAWLIEALHIGQIVEAADTAEREALT